MFNSDFLFPNPTWKLVRRTPNMMDWGKEIIAWYMVPKTFQCLRIRNLVSNITLYTYTCIQMYLKCCKNSMSHLSTKVSESLWCPPTLSLILSVFKRQSALFLARHIWRQWIKHLRKLCIFYIKVNINKFYSYVNEFQICVFYHRRIRSVVEQNQKKKIVALKFGNV